MEGLSLQGPGQLPLCVSGLGGVVPTGTVDPSGPPGPVHHEGPAQWPWAPYAMAQTLRVTEKEQSPGPCGSYCSHILSLPS